MISKTPRTVSIIFILLIFVITIVTVFSISFETKSALKESLQEKLIFVAGTAASDIDGDSFTRLHTGDENTAHFIRIRDQLRHVKEVSPDVHFIYTMRKNGDAVEFVVDGDYGYSIDAADIGEKYPQAEPELLAGFSAPSADAEFTTDQWGTVLSGFYPIRNSTGAVVGIVGVDMDSSKVIVNLDRINLILYFVGIIAMFFIAAGIIVVERRRIMDERVLQESEERYSSLFSNNYSVSLIIDPDTGRIVNANDAAARYYGYSRDQLLALGIHDLNRLPPDKIVRDLKGAKDKKEKHFFSTHYLADGEKRYVEIYSGPITVLGKPLFYSIIHDVTDSRLAALALKESEERYRTLVDQLPDYVIVHRDGILLYINPSAASHLGYENEMLIGKSILPLIAPEYHETVRQAIIRRMTGEVIPPYEMKIRARDGTFRTVLTNGAVITFEGKIAGLNVLTDITERKKAEIAIKTVTKKLTVLNAVTFNEIQNTVFAINGYISLEKTLVDNETVKKYQEKEEEFITKILKLLTFAKSYQNLGVNPPQWQNVNQSFILGISHLDFSVLNRSVHLDDLEIYADSLLERVFFALSDNVLRHAKTATLVTIGYHLEEDDLLIFFEDNGNGIPDPLKERIFEWEFGTQKGMELFLVREILSITGITIKETGTEGKGARFEMHVPHGVFRFPDKK